jgi:hypothetical protein
VAGLPRHDALGGIAGTVEVDARPVHDPEIHAAELGAFVPDPAVVEHAAGPERPQEAAGEEDGTLAA